MNLAFGLYPLFMLNDVAYEEGCLWAGSGCNFAVRMAAASLCSRHHVRRTLAMRTLVYPSYNRPFPEQQP